MDEILNRRGATAALALAAALIAPAHAASSLQDPTRPPAALAAYSAGPAAPSAGPQLQSILVARAPGGRQLAVIDGETVQVGDSFHGARVARIGAGEVELARGAERQVLRLYAEDAGGAITPVKPVRTAARP